MHGPNVIQTRSAHRARQPPPLHPTAKPRPTSDFRRSVTCDAIPANLDRIHGGDQSAWPPALAEMGHAANVPPITSEKVRQSPLVVLGEPRIDGTNGGHGRNTSPQNGAPGHAVEI